MVPRLSFASCFGGELSEVTKQHRGAGTNADTRTLHTAHRDE